MKSIVVSLLIMSVCAGFSLIDPVQSADRDIMYVDISAVGPGDGSMEDPFVSIGDALALTPSEIRIAEGNYPESITVYANLRIGGGYVSGSWYRDSVEHPTVVIGQSEVAVSGSGYLDNLKITGLHITGLPFITRYGIKLDSVAGIVVIDNNVIFGIYAPLGVDGEDCFWTPECDFHGTSGQSAYGIYVSDGRTYIFLNTIYDIRGGNGGDGGLWDYSAGHTDGGDGGHGGSAFGINIYGGGLSSNTVYAITAGNGGNGGNGFDDTGYGGDGGPGGIGGGATAIIAGPADSDLFTNIVFDITSGAGGDGGSGTWNASPAPGGDAGSCTGIRYTSSGVYSAVSSTLDFLTAQSGGNGGSAFGYMGPPLFPGSPGGDGGNCHGVSVSASATQGDISHCIVTDTSLGAGGTGGSGTSPGADGADGTAYGLYADGVAARVAESSYNCLWNHGTGNYMNIAAGTGDLILDPVYVPGSRGDYCLSQIDAGELSDSPCVDAGAMILYEGTTRSDDAPDADILDLGYHYPLPCTNHGDVNASGSITAEDAQISFAIALLFYTPTQEEECAADCNGNDFVSAGDAQAIFFAALGMGDCVNALI